jgi:nucleotidyltransferase/DNA polymerase involved in DNA repair
VILHLDMDAFYAAVEVREDPSLAGKPLIIGHRGRRGVVSTCSYEARKFGVHSAMPSVTAERLCPQAVWLHGRMGLYVEISRRIRRIMRASAPVVEPLSIDEAFLDMTGVVPDLEGGRAAAAEIKAQIVERERLTASVGVAPNKFLAKVASDMEKPDGLVVFSLEDVERRLWPMPIRRLWGVGPKSAERLATLGISTIGDLLRVPESDLVARLGPASAAHLVHLARGEDDRPVQSHHEPKSISEERTYGTDLTDPDEIDRAMLARAEGIARELRRDRLTGRTVHIKVRTGDFTTWTRSLTLRKPTDLAEVIVDAARRMYRERIELRGRGVRLLGVGVSGLEHPGTGQETLFPDPGEEAARKRARATDLVRNKLGEKAVTRARLVNKPGEDEDEPSEASSLPTVD